MAPKYVKVPRHLEVSEPEYLAKRRKGLPSPYVQPTQVVAQPVLRETKVKKLDAEGNVSVYKVLVPEGQVVEGEVQPTDAALEVAPATAVPGTIVEGVGVVNAEGVIVANDIMQQTPPRRRPPPPKKKNKRGGPGRGRKRVIFAEGATEQGTPVSNASGDMLGVPNVKREDGSVAPSDGGDTPMGDAGGEEEEGSGEEGSEDEDQDMERTSTPATPLISSVAPTSAPTMETTTLPETTPAEVIKAPTQAPATTSAPSQDKPETARAEKTVVVTGSSQTMQQTEERDPSSSPDLPLSSTSHSPQNSLNQIPTPVATTDAVVPEEALSELPAPTVAPTVEKEAAISTIFVCAYSIACMRFFRNCYSFNIQIGLQWSFMFFWLVNLGFVATRAHQWQRSKCSELTVLEYSMHCPGVGAGGRGFHVLQNGGTTAVKTYTGALIAGAILATFQVILWAIMTALFVRSTRKLTEIRPLPRSPTTQMQPSTTHAGPLSQHPPPPQPRRMEAWELPTTEAPRLVPQPILPDSDEEDDLSTGPALYTAAKDGDAGANHTSSVVAEYVAQQAVEPGFDP
ncbi:hypothetical protein Ptr902_10935 [Pyrenophora tritici-repentis]|nr:hypothetical protein TUN199_03023 [Pyrenophora tritici-repentis]KAI2477773.1 hypothetical protein Ptr902_10935 [Pyrenophora tritici-repentis]